MIKHNGPCIDELVPTTMPQILTNGVIQARSNVVIIQNAGNVLVNLGDGWTMRPGEKIQFGSFESAVILRVNLRVTFTGGSLIPGQDANQLVEVFEMKVANVSKLNDYVDQSQ